MIDFVIKLIVGVIRNKWKKKRAIYDEFNAIKCSIQSSSITNNIPVELHRLRKFIINNNLLDNENIKEFFEAWLNDPMVVEGVSALNIYTPDELDRLIEQLLAIEL